MSERYSSAIDKTMLRFVTVLAAVVALASSAPDPTNVFEIDITPEEAQKYLLSPPFTEPQLSGRTAVLPLVRWNDPSFRVAEAGPTLGHYWRNGKEIENTQDYLEEVYDASQFHGQDGLGGYAYGYRAPESAKVENRARSGDVTGSYTYKDGNNELIKVRYWADSEGFHQEDNLPKIVLKPNEDTEEVKLARLAHEKAWNEAAAAAAQQPDPQGAYTHQEQQYQSQQYKGLRNPDQQYQGLQNPGQQYQGQQYQGQQNPGQQYQGQQKPGQQYQGQQNLGQQYQGQQYHGAASEPEAVFASAPGRIGKAYDQSQNYQQARQAGQPGGQYNQGGQPGQPGGQYNQGGQPGQPGGQYGQAGQYAKQQDKYEEPEPTGPPRGFFYSFDYPVSVIVPKNAGQGGAVNPGYEVDHDTISLTDRDQQRG